MIEKITIFANDYLGILILVAIMFALLFVSARRIKRFKKFQKTMKVGDRCSTYIGEERYKGRIYLVDNENDMVIVVSDFEVITTRKENVYPL